MTNEALTDPSDPDVEYEELMTPAEVARKFKVNPKTVTRWSRGGKLDAIRTPGGHRRFRRADVEELYDAPAE